MKSNLFILLFIITAFIGFGAKTPKQKKSSIFGSWILVKAETNGITNPQRLMNRTVTYFADGRFEGKISIEGKSMIQNEGIFLIANDTTIITLHKVNNKHLPVAFTYNYKISSDTLHLYGFIFNSLESGLMQPIFIDEFWAKKHNK